MYGEASYLYFRKSAFISCVIVFYIFLAWILVSQLLILVVFTITDPGSFITTLLRSYIFQLILFFWSTFLFLPITIKIKWLIPEYDYVIAYIKLGVLIMYAKVNVTKHIWKHLWDIKILKYYHLVTQVLFRCSIIWSKLFTITMVLSVV